jgi:hypothetical protein
MAEMGYVLSSEETSPSDLVRNAGRAEEVGFATAWVSIQLPKHKNTRRKL